MMRKILPLMVMALVTTAISAQEEKEVVTGAGYASEVYYSLENGTVATVPRDNWDIAFAVPPISLGVSILTNGGAGVELYTYTEGDTAAWETLDTTGMIWNPMYNSLETFELGAFNAHSGEHPDYGWGTYAGMGLITGDSLYILKSVDGTYKKVHIIQRVAGQGVWDFRYANLDGSDEQSVTINTTGEDSNFIYYSIVNQEVLEDRAPASGDWDMWFTRFWDYTIPYTVSGVLINEVHVAVQEVNQEGLDQATFVDFEDGDFTRDISTIGSDWKSFNMGTFSYEVSDSTVYFIKTYSDTDSAYYKIWFTGFGGSADGSYTFMQEKLSAVSTDRPGTLRMLELYPNPAVDHLNITFDHRGTVDLQVIDLSGRKAHYEMLNAGGLTTHRINISHLDTGLYVVRLDDGKNTRVMKFIKQ